MTKVHYFPFLELFLFAIALLILGVAFFLDFNLWLIISFVIIAYLVTVGNSYIIKLGNEKLTLLSLGPFLDTHSISLNSIIKINSEESYTLESDVSAVNTYPIFKRKYCVEYLDRRNKTRKVLFSIHSKAKEKKIFDVLKTLKDVSQ